MIEASSFDRKSLAAMVKRTKVVISTVGPYLKYGDALVAVCAESGTHYVDITGETGFVRRNIDNYHELARETGAKVGGTVVVAVYNLLCTAADPSALLLPRLSRVVGMTLCLPTWAKW